MAKREDESGYVFEAGVSAAREEFVTDRLREFSNAHSRRTVQWDDPQYPSSPIHLYVLDREGAVVGGLVGRTHHIPTWLDITVLWVDEPNRGQGLGRQLMERAEGEARARGCRYARTATSDFNAPGFYEKLGYRLYGILEDCPAGETVYYYRKDL